MHLRTRATAVAAAVGVAVATAAVAVAAPAEAVAPVPVITIHVNNSGIRLSSGNSIHAGRILFKVVTGRGDHIVNFARFHNGYTPAQLGADL
ncbi:MAG: hypothetical protein ACRDVG_11720, partial [Jatrophihabitantaceae bacterium]